MKWCGYSGYYEAPRCPYLVVSLTLPLPSLTMVRQVDNLFSNAYEGWKKIHKCYTIRYRLVFRHTVSVLSSC